LSADFKADEERMREEAMGRYLHFVVMKEESILRILNDVNNKLPQGKRLTLPEEIRRNLNEYLDVQLRKMWRRREDILKGSRLVFDKDPDRVEKNQKLGGKLLRRLKVDSSVASGDILLFPYLVKQKEVYTPQNETICGLHPEYGPIFIRGHLAVQLAAGSLSGQDLETILNNAAEVEVVNKVGVSKLLVVDEEGEFEQWLAAYREAKKEAENALKEKTRSRFVNEIYNELIGSDSGGISST